MNLVNIETRKQFEDLKKGDIVICQFRGSKELKTFKLFREKTPHNEIVLQKKGNIYFNYDMFLEGTSNLKEIKLLKND